MFWFITFTIGWSWWAVPTFLIAYALSGCLIGSFIYEGSRNATGFDEQE